MNKDALITKLREYFRGRADVAFAYLFGPIAKGTSHSESDVDIGVYFRPGTRALEYESEIRYPGESDIWSDLERLPGDRRTWSLNRAPSTLFSAVIGEGSKIFSADEGLFSRLSAAVNDLADDFRYFISDFVKIKERSRSLSTNDRVRLVRLIDFVQDQMPDFKKFAGVSQKQYERDISIKRNLERWAETLANASIDIG